MLLLFKELVSVSQILNFARSSPTADSEEASVARLSSLSASCSLCRSCHLGQADSGVGRVLV